MLRNNRALGLYKIASSRAHYYTFIQDGIDIAVIHQAVINLQIYKANWDYKTLCVCQAVHSALQQETRVRSLGRYKLHSFLQLPGRKFAYL